MSAIRRDTAAHMHLRVLLPTEALFDQDVVKIVAEAENGSFCLLPRHVDFVTALAPGILSVVSPEGKEQFLAVHGGTLVKFGYQVLVSTRYAVIGPELGALQRAVDNQFQVLDERERLARTALSKLEADLVRRVMEQE